MSKFSGKIVTFSFLFFCSCEVGCQISLGDEHLQAWDLKNCQSNVVFHPKSVRLFFMFTLSSHENPPPFFSEMCSVRVSPVGINPLKPICSTTSIDSNLILYFFSSMTLWLTAPCTGKIWFTLVFSNFRWLYAHRLNTQNISTTRYLLAVFVITEKPKQVNEGLETRSNGVIDWNTQRASVL